MHSSLWLHTCEEALRRLELVLSFCLEKEDAQVHGWRRKTLEVIVHLFQKDIETHGQCTVGQSKQGEELLLNKHLEVLVPHQLLK